MEVIPDKFQLFTRENYKENKSKHIRLSAIFSNSWLCFSVVPQKEAFPPKIPNFLLSLQKPLDF